MQIIKFLNGQAQTLLDSGPVNLAELGPISVHRSSEILFDEGDQKFYIHFLEPALVEMNAWMRDLYFPTYKQAVDYEINVINSARKLGIL